MDFSFKGGLEGAAYNAPSAIFVFVKGKQLVIADLGDLGDMVSSVWSLENWFPKITGEMGYLLLFGGLVHAELMPMLVQVYERVARDAGLELKKIREWQG